MIKLGDKVKSKFTGEMGVVTHIFESGSIQVLEKVNPMVIITYDNEEKLEIVEAACLKFEDEREDKKMELVEKEVLFEPYCCKCKHKDNKESEDPCHDCLNQPYNENSHRPYYYEEDKQHEKNNMSK